MSETSSVNTSHCCCHCCSLRFLQKLLCFTDLLALQDDGHNREDIESGIPIASNAQRAVHAGTAGLEETNFTEDND